VTDQCPHVLTTDDGTRYCSLAVSASPLLDAADELRVAVTAWYDAHERSENVSAHAIAQNIVQLLEAVLNGDADGVQVLARQRERTPDDLLDEVEVAQQLATSVRAIRNWRQQQRGPAYVRVGGRVRYRRSDIADWIDAGRVQPPNR